MIPNPSTHPRILFVTPEAAFIPEGTENRPNYTSVHTGGFGDFLAELMQPSSGKICFMKDIPAVTSKHATPTLWICY